MKAHRTRTVAAPRQRVWEVVADPWHQPRWWPHTERVEAVTSTGWTSVLRSRRNRIVRVDWTVEISREPVERRWAQELEGTAFERLFVRYAIDIALEDAAEGTRVTLTIEQRVRGVGRALPILFRRGLRRQLDAALDGLEEVL